MSENSQLNKTLLAAKAGCVNSMWEIKYRFLDLIHTLSEDNRNSIANQSDFEEDCFKVIEETVARYDITKGEFPQLLYRCLTRRLSRTKARFKKRLKQAVVVPFPLKTDDDGEEVEIDIIDDMAAVDNEIMLNERIAGLATGDPRKLVILKSWTDPYYCDSETAVLLAEQLGGKAESHRKEIARFRSKCQKALAHAN